jgi:hypothetical protein
MKRRGAMSLIVVCVLIVIMDCRVKPGNDERKVRDGSS